MECVIHNEQKNDESPKNLNKNITGQIDCSENNTAVFQNSELAASIVLTPDVTLLGGKISCSSDENEIIKVDMASKQKVGQSSTAAEKSQHSENISITPVIHADEGALPDCIDSSDFGFLHIEVDKTRSFVYLFHIKFFHIIKLCVGIITNRAARFQPSDGVPS